MTIQIIPLSIDTEVFTQRTALAGRDFSFRFVYVERESRWLMDISDGDDQIIAAGIKLVPGVVLVDGRMDLRLFDGLMMLIDNPASGLSEGINSDPTRNNLADRYSLVYVSRDEIPVLPRAVTYRKSGAQGIAPINEVLPALSNEIEPFILNATSGVWSGSVLITYTYQWFRYDEMESEFVAIEGETYDYYAIDFDTDSGLEIKVRVTATNDYGSAIAESVAIEIGEPPVWGSSPVLSGTETLEVTGGTYTGDPSPIFTYQWYRDDVAIEGETGAEYTIDLDTDAGTTIRCRVTLTNTWGVDAANTDDFVVAEAFVPSDLGSTDLTGWYTPTSIQESSGNLTAWNDASGNARHFGTPSGTIPISTLEGLACVDLNGSSHSIASGIAMSAFVGSGDRHVFVVCNQDTISNETSGYANPVLADQSGYWSMGFYVSSGNRASHFNWDSNFDLASVARAHGTPLLLEAAKSGSNIYVRAHEIGAASSTAIGSAASGATQVVTGNMRIGVDYTGTKFFDGKIGEIVIVKRALTSGEQSDFRNYFARIWGANDPGTDLY